MTERVHRYAREGHVGKNKPNCGSSGSSRNLAFVAVLCCCVRGDGILVSRGTRAGSIANGWCGSYAGNGYCGGYASGRRCGRCAARVSNTKLGSSWRGARSLVGQAAAKLSAGSERHLVVSGAAREGTALAAHDWGDGRDGGAHRR